MTPAKKIAPEAAKKPSAKAAPKSDAPKQKSSTEVAVKQANKKPAPAKQEEAKPAAKPVKAQAKVSAPAKAPAAKAASPKQAPAKQTPSKQDSGKAATAKSVASKSAPAADTAKAGTSKTANNKASEKTKVSAPAAKENSANRKAAPKSANTNTKKNDKKAASSTVTPKSTQKPEITAKNNKKDKPAPASKTPVAAKPAPAAKPAAAKKEKTPAAKPAAPVAETPAVPAAKVKSSLAKVIAAGADKTKLKPKPEDKRIALAAAKSKKPADLKSGGVTSVGNPTSVNGDKPKADKKEILARILAMRADDTRKNARQAASKAVKPNSNQRVPASVIKAKEAADARKAAPVVAPPPAPVVDEAKEKRVNIAKKRKAPYSKTELRELRDILKAERDRLLRDLQLMNDIALSSEENMSRSFSNHQADAATDSSALETTFMTRRYEEERLQMVLNSLKRLDEGTYGLCEMCDGEEPLGKCESCPYIPVGRLRAKPFAKFCVPCREVLEKKNKR